MPSRRRYQVSEVARIARVTVRTLHHYDELGLLAPSQRSEAGYRLYDDADLLRLQQILVGRELGLSLDEIGRSLDDPDFDARRALRRQRAQLQERATRTAEMIRAVDRALAVLEHEPEGDGMDMKDLFDGFDPAEHEDEARERWGNTEAYAESARRTSRYGEAEWKRLRDEQDELYRRGAALMQTGVAAGSEQGMDVAEGLRSFIDRWFYPCSRAMHLGLADLYENDRRFADNIDRYGAGLTAFLVQAIRANARRG